MVVMSISQSVEEELVYLGASLAHLRDHLRGRVEPSDALSEAERKALADGICLQVSWVASAMDARYIRNALHHAYRERHGNLPGYARLNGQRAEGVQQVEHKTVSVASLDWSDWLPMKKASLANVPNEPGVYRIRVAKP